jgi:hypothetical protein
MREFASRKQHFVILNCSGQKFRIARFLLDKFPNTLLGTEEKRASFWLEEGKNRKPSRTISLSSRVLLI